MTEVPWHKESALGWLEQASKAREQRSPGNPREIALTPEDKLSAAIVHALLYIGDMCAPEDVTTHFEYEGEDVPPKSGGVFDTFRGMFEAELQKHSGAYRKGDKIKLAGFSEFADGEYVIDDLKDNDLLLRRA